MASLVHTPTSSLLVRPRLVHDYSIIHIMHKLLAL